MVIEEIEKRRHENTIQKNSAVRNFTQHYWATEKYFMSKIAVLV